VQQKSTQDEMNLFRVQLAEAIKDVFGKIINPNSIFGKFRLSLFARKMTRKPHSRTTKLLFKAMNRPAVDAPATAPRKLAGKLEGTTPCLLPNHLDFLLDENSLQDMIDRKDELDEWIRINRPDLFNKYEREKNRAGDNND
jgi:hypothetical protein